MSKNVFNLKTFLDDRLKRNGYQKAGKTVEAFYGLIEMVYAEMIEQALEAMIEEGKGITLRPEHVEKTEASKAVSMCGTDWVDLRMKYEDKQELLGKHIINELEAIRSNMGLQPEPQSKEQPDEEDDYEDELLEKVNSLREYMEKEFRNLRKKTKWMEG